MTRASRTTGATRGARGRSGMRRRIGALVIGAILAGCSGESPPPGGTGGAGGEVVDAGGPSCTGTPAPCAMRLGIDCDPTLGCTDHGACSGQPLACDLLKTEGPCTLHFGCTWKTGETTCTGGPLCGDFNDKMTCLMQPGCAWTTSMTGCTGSSDACADLMDLVLCAAQEGCAWQGEACGGDPPIPCTTFSSQSGCEAQPGCSWR